MSSAGTEGAVSAGTSIAEGAAIGTAIMPGIGTAIGAGIGAIAGAFGFGSSKKKRKARKLAKQSRAIQNLILRKNMVVEYTVASAMAAVGGEASGAGTQKTSTTLGVLSSLQNQAISNLKVNTELFNRNEKIEKLKEEADKLSGIQAGIMGAFQGVAGAMAPLGGGKLPTTEQYLTQARSMGVSNPGTAGIPTSPYTITPFSGK
jgi:gas vesicle protein